MKNQGVINGLLLGLCSVLASLLLYLVSMDLYLNWWVQLVLSLGLTIFFMSRAGVMSRREGNGFISFKDTLKPTFLTYAIGALIGTIFIYVMYHYVDPGLVDLTKEKALEQTEKMMSTFGAPQDDIDEAIEKMEQQSFESGIGKTLLQYCFQLIFGFILALIISAFIKKNPPETAV